MNRLKAALRIWSHQEGELPWFLLLMPLNWAAGCLMWKRMIKRDRGLNLGVFCLVGAFPYKVAAMFVAAFLSKQECSWMELVQALAEFLFRRLWRKDACEALRSFRPIVAGGFMLIVSFVGLAAWAACALSR